MRFYVYISLLPSEIKDMLIHTMTALLLMYYYYKVFAHQKFIVVFSAPFLHVPNRSQCSETLEMFLVELFTCNLYLEQHR